MADQEVDLQEILKGMREYIGALAQENAILKAQLAKSPTDS